jgi:predicted ferric reductase
MTSQTWWYVARSGGIMAWAMLTLSVFWGLALSSRFLGKKPRPNWMLDLHRFIGGLAVVFTAVHVIALVADSYVSFGLLQIVVPFTGDYHPAAVAWGVVALYFLLAVEITSLLRKRLSKRVWRATHMLSFPLFATSTVHMLMVGTDRAHAALRVAVVLAIGAITTGTFVRIAKIERHSPARAVVAS